MIQINGFLSIAATGFNLVSLLVTDPYGTVQVVIGLSPDEARLLSDRLMTLAPIEVGHATETVDWASLTKAQIITRVFEDYGVDMRDSDTKAELVREAQELAAAS